MLSTPQIGHSIREFRRAQGISQVAFAHLCGISLPTLQNLEAGKGNPSLRILAKLGALIGFDLRWESKPIDWARLAGAGVPITCDTPASSGDWLPELKRALANLEVLTPRERDALQAFLLAARDHFPTSFRRWFGKSVSARKLCETPINGNIIKLRRLAISALAERT